MKFEEPKVEFITIDLKQSVSTDSCANEASQQSGSHCTTDPYTELSCGNAAPRMC